MIKFAKDNSKATIGITVNENRVTFRKLKPRIKVGDEFSDDKIEEVVVGSSLEILEFYTLESVDALIKVLEIVKLNTTHNYPLAC